MSRTRAEISRCIPLRIGAAESSTVPALAVAGPRVLTSTKTPTRTPKPTRPRPVNSSSATGENEWITYFHQIRRQNPATSSPDSRRISRNRRIPETSLPYRAGTGTSLARTRAMLR
jgi:hypothetical protein